jgi:histidinol-phosphate aminotransferase
MGVVGCQAVSTVFPSSFVPPHVARLDVYQPGKPIEELERELGITGVIKVASNENPLGPSPRALAAIPGALAQLHRYPDASGVVLRRALAARFDCEPDQIGLGNGSNDLLYQIVLATCELADEVLSHEHAFMSYRLAAQVAGRPFVAAPATPEFACDPDALIAAITPRTKLVVVGTPNNPTGSVISRAAMDQLLAALPARALLVIDEAYIEYAAMWPEIDHADGVALWRRDPRVIVLRTFSKAYGLAGLRVGYALANKVVIEMLGRVGRTFHVNSLAQVAALAALDDTEHVTRSARHARRAIERYAAELCGSGVRIYPSLGNFVLVDCGRPSTPIYEKLLKGGVIVRPMAGWGLLNHIRLSVARDEDLPRVIGAFNDVLAA